jgi:tetratricopeptide (TPR) repeat protein
VRARTIPPCLSAFTAALVLLAGGTAYAQAPLAVRAWEGHLDLPTYEEGAPDANAPFDVFEPRKFNYPYTLRENLTDRRRPERWRTLNLENEHLKVSVLPDLGGHLYSCVDKATGAEMFYAQTAIKKARVAYRGAWTALGIEFNFPVSHNWATASPVDHALVRNADGSATIWVGNRDRVYGMQWRVGLTLRPNRARLEQDVALYNRSDTRHRFYWWNNAGVRSWDDSVIEYPMRHTASHGFRNIDTWPVNAAGVDLRVVKNHLYGPVSEFSHGSREAFMGVYHPHTKSGVAHYSSPLDSPTKKIWSWGGDADGLDWRKALSDDESTYLEVQSGLFRNQETYAFLEPQQTIRFTEYWLPVRDLGGITRATPDAVMHLARTGTALALALNVATPVRGNLVLSDGAREVRREPVTVSPAEVLRRTFADLPAAARYTVDLQDAQGRSLIRHTEDTYDFTPAEQIQVGPVPAPPRIAPADRTEGDWIAQGMDLELNGKRLQAWDTYTEARRAFPRSLALAKAQGRLAVVLLRFSEAAPLLDTVAQQWPTDAELRYYQGLAHAALGHERETRAALEAALPFASHRAAAGFVLAQLDARSGQPREALRVLKEATSASPQSVRTRALEIALLRATSRAREARARLAEARAIDPLSSWLRHEAVLLGTPDAALWAHLGEDPERVLDLATEYMGAGLWKDALALLERKYPHSGGLRAEPGAVAPQDHPEVVYYRGYCREQLGGSPLEDYRAASQLSTLYIFPSRAHSAVVFTRVLEASPNDATALSLRGSLLLAMGLPREATRDWQKARELKPSLPTLHRNLGRTLLLAPGINAESGQIEGDTQGALAVLQEGMTHDPRNVDLYQSADQALSLLGRSAAERAASLRRYPDLATMPSGLVLRLALALAEDGHAEEGEALLKDRFFAREETGTNVRQVYVEIQLLKALAEVRAGRPEGCARIETMHQEVPGFSFTKDGLEAFVNSARVQYASGEIAALCKDDTKARAHWTRAAASGRGNVRELPYAYLASQRLGGDAAKGWSDRLPQALLAADTQELETSFPGTSVHTQGLILRALGREDEARARFRRVLLLPDVRVAHYLSRRSLAGEVPF